MVLERWTGREAQLLRLSLRMSVRDFAGHLGVAVRTVSRWSQYGADRSPRPEFQAMLDTALAQASPEERVRFRTSLAQLANDVGPGDSAQARVEIEGSTVAGRIPELGRATSGQEVAATNRREFLIAATTSPVLATRLRRWASCRGPRPFRPGPIPFAGPS